MFQMKTESDVGVFVPVLQVRESKRNKHFNFPTPLIDHDIRLGFTNVKKRT